MKHSRPFIAVAISTIFSLPNGESRWISGWGGASASAQQARTFSSGQFHTLSLCVDSTVWSYGYNSTGELGDNTSTNSKVPIQVHGPGNVGFLSSIISVSAGKDYSLALKRDGTVWSWGYNGLYALGDGTTAIGRSTPVQVVGPGAVGFLTGITTISAGYSHVLVLKNDSTVWAWGDNGAGQLGDNLTVGKNYPVQVLGPGGVGFLTGIIAISAGNNFSLALKKDGTVWSWGLGTNYQLGDGTFASKKMPVQVKTGTSSCITYLCSITAISAGSLHSLALKTDGTVWTWGSNSNGQFGNGVTSAGANAPVQAGGGITGIKAVIAGGLYSIVIKTDSTVWAFGSNAKGELGDGTNTTPRASPLQVLGPGGIGFLTSVTGVSANGNLTLALKKDGTLWGCGLNAQGQLGDNTLVDKWTPTQPIGLCTVMPLPVELLYFTATAENNSLVRCDWSTGTEINSDYFAVERSQYGITFEQIGTVKGAGNSSTTLNYVFYDHEPYSGVSYYRLKQFDYNGTYTYSEIRPVYIGTFGLITIYPNPSTNGSIEYIVASEGGGEVSVKVYDVLGRTVISNTETIGGGAITKKLSTAGLSSGSYLLQVTNGNLEKTQKQFVIK